MQPTGRVSSISDRCELEVVFYDIMCLPTSRDTLKSLLNFIKTN